MSTPYIGECRLVGFNFQPNGWSFCNGATIAIAENETLFNLIGTTYGGDGQQTFKLPDLQGRVPVHQGSGYVLGQVGGVETVTLTVNTMPSHTHPNYGSSAQGNGNLPANNLLAGNTNTPIYTNYSAVDTAMNNAMIGPAGGSQPHENMQPYLVLNWVISLYGVYPTQN
jgi:microcystin-dependent protein